MELNKRSLKINEPAKYAEFQALPKDANYDKKKYTVEDYHKGMYWHFPCGTYDNMIPVLIECQVDCHFHPNVRAARLSFEFFADEDYDMSCTKFEA